MATLPARPPVSRRTLLLGALGGVVGAGALSGCTATQLRPTDPAPTAAIARGTRPVLEQWYHQYQETGAQAAAERYAREYPDALVTVTWQPGDYEQTILESLETDAAPDVFEYANGPTIDMIRDGLVTDVTDVFGDARDDFVPAVFDRVTYEGRVWAVPQLIDMQLLVYRRSMLVAAGVEPPTSIEALVDAAGALTVDGVAGLFLGASGGAETLGGPMLRAAGLDFLDDNHQVGFADPAAARALSVLRDLYTSGHLLLDTPYDWYAPDAMIQGRTAMQFTGLWTFPELLGALGDDVGVLPWPAMDGGRPTVSVGAYGACVNARGDVEASKQFVRWLWVESTDRQIDFATSYGLHIPARTSIAQQAEQLHVGAAAEAVELAQRHGAAQTPLLWTEASAAAFSAMMVRVVREGADPRTQIAETAAVVASELARIGGSTPG